MALQRGTRKDVTISERTKEKLVFGYFFGTSEKWAKADDIVKAWDPENSERLGGVFAKGIGAKDRFLSRAGASKLCKRLFAEGVLERKPEIGYNNRKVFFFSLKDDWEGFYRIASKLQDAPMLLIGSAYGKNGIRKHIIPKIQDDLKIKMKDWEETIRWVLERSPTAFAIGLDKSLAAGEISLLQTGEERLRAFLHVLDCAMTADRSTLSRGQLIVADAGADDIEKALRNIKP